MPRRVQIIANPIAGGGRGSRAAPELAQLLEARSIAAEVFFTQRGGDARAHARTLSPDDWHAVVAVGGDGTINEVLNGLSDLRLRFGILPLGTANVLATELGLDPAPLTVAKIVDDDHTIDAAVGVAGDRRFLLFAGFGLDARAVHRLAERRKGLGGKTKWVGPVAHAIRHGARDRLRIETAEGEILEDLSQVLVTRICNYGGWFTMPGDIDIEDGLLHVFGFRQRSRIAWAATMWRAWRGSLRPGRDVVHLPTSAVRVDSEHAVPCQVDGDPAGATPTAIRLENAKARLLMRR